MADKKNRKQYAEGQFNLGVDCYEKDEIDKAIEHWSAIQREDDREIYALVQFRLGVCFLEQDEPAKAIEYWSKIRREDDKEAYAIAQFNLGERYQKQDELVKAIEHWNNIRREDDKEAYAIAQLSLGLVYHDQNEQAKAIEYFSNIQREDDKELYATAQFNLGVIYHKQNELAKVIEHFSNIRREDDKEVYAKAQLNLAGEDYNQGELVKAIEHWSSIQREDDKKIYAQAQFNIALSYYEGDNLDKAIEYWSNVQRADDKELYVQAQFNVGLIYFDEDDLVKAIVYWSNIQREDNEKNYAQAQLNLGLAYNEQGNAVKAIEVWSNIQCEDDRIQYAKAQFNLGSIYCKEDDLVKAKKYTGEALEQQNDFLKASILLDKITILQAYAKGENEEDYTYFKKGLDNINDDVNKILESLIIKFKKGKPERKVATYTTVRVAKLFIENKEESFHLNIANRMNDTTEGQNLFKWMGYIENTEATNTIYGFLTSFTFNHNSLNQFRLYGKTEDKEGTGVSFVVSTDIFSDEHDDNYIKLNAKFGQIGMENDAKLQENQHKDKNEEQDKKLISEKIPLYRCIYINPDNGYVSLSQRSRYSFFLEHGDLEDAENADKQTAYNEYKEKIDEVEVEVRAKLIAIRESYRKINNSLKMDEEELKAQLTDINADREKTHKELAEKQQLRQQTDQLIRKILLPLCFLTKHASFEEEAECRIIYITDIANEKVTFEKGRLFVAYGVPVLDRQTNKSFLNKIYLGPKVEDVVKIELQHLYYQQGIKEPIRIEKSNLPLA